MKEGVHQSCHPMYMASPSCIHVGLKLDMFYYLGMYSFEVSYASKPPKMPRVFHFIGAIRYLRTVYYNVGAPISPVPVLETKPPCHPCLTRRVSKRVGSISGISQIPSPIDQRTALPSLPGCCLLS